MSKIEDLIKQYCPNGCKWKRLRELVSYEQPSKYIVKSTNYSDEYEVPVLTAGQSFVLGYTNEHDGIYNASSNNPVIIFDDFTGAFHWVDFPFKVKSSAMKMLRVGCNDTTLRYVYHVMRNIGYTSDEHKRLWISLYSNFQIPIPPRPVQEEIVRILDEFTELEKELEKELEMRKKQYAWYRDELLTFGDDVEWKQLGDKSLFNFRYGTGNNIPVDTGGKYDVYGSNGIVSHINDYNCEDVSIIGHIGAYAGIVNRCRGKCFVTYNGTIASVVDTTRVDSQYFHHVLNELNLQSMKKGSQPFLSVSDFSHLQIPVPSLQEQQRIVEILDTFDTLTTDLIKGLPAEIKMRHQQYEYYRDYLFGLLK